VISCIVPSRGSAWEVTGGPSNGMNKCMIVTFQSTHIESDRHT